MVDYNRIALFVRVVKAGSFTAAAAEVGLPKSSVSRSVSRLEQELGVRLLQRTTRKLSLTDAGHSYYESVRENVAALDSAEEAAREHGAAPTGTVRMTAAPDFVAFAPLLAQFQRQHPGIRLDLLLTSRVVDLVSESVDLAVRAGRLPDSSLIARRIGSTDGALMASPEYLRRRGRPRSFAELASHEWVLYRAVAGRASLILEGPEGPQTLEVAGRAGGRRHGLLLRGRRGRRRDRSAAHPHRPRRAGGRTARAGAARPGATPAARSSSCSPRAGRCPPGWRCCGTSSSSGSGGARPHPGARATVPGRRDAQRVAGRR